MIRRIARPLLARDRHFAVSLVLAALAATLLVAALLWSARLEAISTTQTTALNYSRTLEVRLDATFRRADAVLRALAAATPVEALAPGAEAQFGERLNRELSAMARDFEELIALRIVDANGDQRYVSAGGGATVNYADRDFHQRYRSDRSAELLFSEVVIGRLTGRQTMVITRPIRDSAGRYLGAVLAPMDLDVFQDQFRRLDIGNEGVVFLRRSDASGRLVLRWPHIDTEMNSPMPLNHTIWRAVAAGRPESLHEYIAFTDGVPRISGTVLVRGYPFFLTVALSKNEQLMGWQRMALTTALTWVALVVALWLLMRRLRAAGRERLSLERRLQEAQRIEALGTLAGGIAHDFNNILAAIIGNVALARQDLGPQHPALTSLDQVRKASLRGRDLVQQILAIGRHQPQALVSLPLQPLIEETVMLLRPTLPPTLRLQLRSPEAPLHAAVDATQFQQVLMNLCTNAVHAMAGRPGQIEIGLETEPPGLRGTDGHKPDPHLHLWVRDDGAGMAAETRARVFEPFFTTKPSGQGTGLGLAVVHGIVAAHGGEIRIDSAPGQGTTVHVFLPLATATPAPAAPAPQTANSHTGGGRHVLYVDDDEVVALLVERLLTREGWRVTVARNGAEAMACFSAAPQDFDAVVTDFNMPGMSGLDVARALAALRADLPVVISSGYITDELRQAAAAAGVRGVMQKQNTLEELAALLKELLAEPASVH